MNNDKKIISKNFGDIKEIEATHHIEYFEAMFKAMKISCDKNHDYATSNDPLSNFRNVKRAGINPATGLLVRMMDKFSRIENFFNKGELKVENESVEDALMDLGNYCFLMIALLKDEEKNKNI